MFLTRMMFVILSLGFASSSFSQDADPTPDPIDDVIRSEATTTSTVTTNGNTTTTLKSPPASAISPTINTSNSDLCTFGVAGAIQTQILGISTGTQITDENCERLKNSKTLYDMGMKVAAVSLMCQDKRVFDAMMNAGTPCPYDGLIGQEAKAAWKVNAEATPSEEGEKGEKKEMDIENKTLIAGGGIAGLLLLLILL
jgi:hypothetical protein